MAEISSADHSVSPPRIRIPRSYNAAHDLLERNLVAGRGDRVAYVDDRGSCTYAGLARRVNCFASSLAGLGLRREERVLLCMLDTIDWPVAFLGAIKAGIVPVAVNTLLRPQDYDYMLRDSRAAALLVSQALLPSFEESLGSIPTLRSVVVSSTPGAKAQPWPERYVDFDALLEGGSDSFECAETVADEPCFWLYSSGSTGSPKGTVHVHSSMIETAELYGRPVLGIREDDVVFSAAKLFFAYGLGNGLTFPISVGATTVLMAERPTPEAVFQRLTGEAPAALAAMGKRPTIFYGVPTLYAGMLANASFPAASQLSLRVATSAGEALPKGIGTGFTERTGVEILDGIGSTEMLHIFLSNQTGSVRYGTTGKPVPGYTLKLVGDDGREVGDDDVGDLYISGPSAAAQYWNQREKTRDTFQGVWTRSGDKYQRDSDGYYTYAGRSDDMLKVSGQYVSPFEVESAVATHPMVLEAAVVGAWDADKLLKPKAFVVLKEPSRATDALAQEIKAHVKDRLAPFKYPRWVEFVDELPKTATGKIQRYRLRDREGFTG